jgi:phosphoglycolate phosphatase
MLETPILPGIRAAIIDLDGTMIHTAPDFHVAVNRMRAELGLTPLDIETITHFVGKGTENLIRRVLGVDFDEPGIDAHFEQALASYLKHYLAINGDYSSIPASAKGCRPFRPKACVWHA